MKLLITLTTLAIATSSFAGLKKDVDANGKLATAADAYEKTNKEVPVLNLGTTAIGDGFKFLGNSGEIFKTALKGTAAEAQSALACLKIAEQTIGDVVNCKLNLATGVVVVAIQWAGQESQLIVESIGDTAGDMLEAAAVPAEICAQGLKDNGLAPLNAPCHVIAWTLNSSGQIVRVFGMLGGKVVAFAYNAATQTVKYLGSAAIATVDQAGYAAGSAKDTAKAIVRLQPSNAFMHLVATAMKSVCTVFTPVTYIGHKIAGDEAPECVATESLEEDDTNRSD